MFNAMMVNLFRLHTTQKIYLRSFCSISSRSNHLDQTQHGKSSNLEDQQCYEQIIKMGYFNYFDFDEIGPALSKFMRLKMEEEFTREMSRRVRIDVDKLRDERLERDLTPKPLSYDKVIFEYFKAGELEKAFGVIERMKMENAKPCVDTFDDLLYTLCRAGMLKYAWRVFDVMVKEYGIIRPTVATYNVLIVHGLCSEGNLVCEMAANGICPDVCTGCTDDYDDSMVLYPIAGNSSKCIELYEDMKNRGVRPTIYTYCLLISRCRKEGTELVEKLFSEMLRFNLAPDSAVYNAMINCYVEHGDVQKATSLYDEMVGKIVHPDELTYNILIKGHLKEGNLSQVNDLVCKMKANGIRLNVATFNILVKGLCELKDFDGAYGWCREMVGSGFIPNSNICNDLLVGLREKGKFTEAQLMFEEFER